VGGGVYIPFASSHFFLILFPSNLFTKSQFQLYNCKGISLSTCFTYVLNLIYNFIIWAMDSVLLETKTLVELICHYIRDQTRVFSVFTLASDIRSSKISRHFHCCCFENTDGLWFAYIKRNERWK
jgi:hypothetical protein